MDNNATYDDGNGNASDSINGHYVIGEFIADSTTLEITITASVVYGINTDDVNLNAYQIRKLNVE